MFKLTFLKGGVPLTKTITPTTKSSYPNVKNFTSEVVTVKDISGFHAEIKSHAGQGECLLKGSLSHQLNNEPRKGCMPPNAVTQYICFDLDKAPFSTPDEFMKAIGLPSTSYVVQYSSSYRLNPKDKRLSCHIFVVMNRTMSPQNLKAWLMWLNFNTPVLESSIELGDSHNFLRWPLDITTCQADKLIYIAPPVFERVTDPFPNNRIQLVIRPDLELNIDNIAVQPLDALKKQARAKRDALRDSLGLPRITSKAKVVGEYTVQPGVGEASAYEIVEVNDEFTRLNINGGDSGAYWYYNADHELIHNFKGEDSVYMKELLPDLYKQLSSTVRDNLQSTSASGDLVLAFREKRTAKYWKGLYNPGTPSLEIYEVDSKDKLHDFLQGHGLVPPPYIPEWTMIFEPHNSTIVDEDKHIVNTFVPPIFARKSGSYPIIQQCIDSAVGTGPIQEHFLNWLACIFQHHRKCGTAWVLHGTQGTGKGVLFNDVIVPLLTRAYTEHINANALASDFDGWQEGKLLVFIDEIEVDMFENKKANVESKLKKMITERTDDIHRKNVNRYTVPSYCNYIFGSNKPHMVQVPMNDRRFNVGQYQSKRWDVTRKQIETDLPKELPAFAEYIMTRKACLDTARVVLDTEDRRLVQQTNMSAVQVVIKEILEGNLDELLSEMPDNDTLMGNGIVNPYAQAYFDLLKFIATQLPSKLTRDQLITIFAYRCGLKKESPQAFTNYVKHNGLNIKDIKIDGVKYKGIQINWKPFNPDYLKRFELAPIRRIK